MLKRKKNTKEKQSSTELSTYQLAPGILKVFGDQVSPGSNYKSVRASTISTSQEIVRQALEKYSIPDCDPGEYVLCDVVGHFKVTAPQEHVEEEEQVWVTEYVRVVHDYEKPLVLQSLWKPSGNRLRRFELRKREEVEASGFYINTVESTDRNSCCSVGSDSEQSSTVSGADSSTNISPETNSKTGSSNSSHRKSNSLNRVLSTTSTETYPVPEEVQDLHQPNSMPFLLLLSGYDIDLDELYYCLEEQVTIVGNKSCPTPRPDIKLCAADILAHHCYVYKKVSIEENAMETNLDEIRFLVYLEPIGRAVVKINGKAISQKTLLEPGDLVLFGSFYLFMFKDPTQIVGKGVRLTWLKDLEEPSGVENKGSQTDDIAFEADTLSVDSRNNEPDTKEVEPRFTKNDVCLAYSVEDEDSLLDNIMGVMDNESSVFKLTPAYILVMVMEHSAAYFSGLQTRRLLLKISGALQSVAWEKTKEIGKNMTEIGSDVSTMLDGVIEEIKPVIFWMANALEMMHFLQCNLTTYLSYQSPMSGSQESLDAADEELLTVLEEIIMFTFQQTVYHLTKVLYSALPAILDTNPFQVEDGSSDDEGTQKNPPQAVALVLSIFERTREAAVSFMVHPQIIGQLFAYLFFFSNASVFNSLMERGAGGKFYKWTKGVQIRGNLEYLEEWATQSNLSEEFNQYMKKLMAAVDILSTPKVQLMQMEWSSLREEYADLNPAQLQQLLSEYQLGNKPKPKGWFPPPEEVEFALKTSEVLESFATHPPLLLPTTGFRMNLSVEPVDPDFTLFVKRLNSRYSTTVEGGAITNPVEEKSNAAPEELKAVNSRIQKVVSGEMPRKNNPSEHFEALGMRLERLGSSAASRFRPPPKKQTAVNDGADKKDTQEHDFPATEEPYKKNDTRVVLDNSSNNATGEGDDDELASNSSTSGRVTVLGNPKSIQVVPRKTSRKEEVTIRISPNVAVMNGHGCPKESTPVSSREKTGLKINLNGYPDEPISDDADEYYDGSILTESDLDSYDEEYADDDEDDTSFDNTFVVDLKKEKSGLGLGLIDGMFTPLETPGIFVRTLLPLSPAAKDGRVCVGDRILSVNGKSLVGADYASAMESIRSAGERLSFTMARSSKSTISKITASTC